MENMEREHGEHVLRRTCRRSQAPSPSYHPPSFPFGSLMLKKKVSLAAMHRKQQSHKTERTWVTESWQEKPPSGRNTWFVTDFSLLSLMQDFPGGLDGKASAYNARDSGSSLGPEDLLEKEMAIHSSILAWKIPWMEEPGRLQSTESQKVRHDWTTSLSLTNSSREGVEAAFWCWISPGFHLPPPLILPSAEWGSGINPFLQRC